MIKVLIPLTAIILLSSFFFFFLRYIIEKPEDVLEMLAIYTLSGFDNSLEIDSGKNLLRIIIIISVIALVFIL